MISFIAKNKSFYIAYAVMFVILSGISVFIDKADSFLYINHNHNNFFDFFFKYITNLGDGFIYLPLFILFLFIKFRYSLVFALTYLLEGGLSQFLKKIVFPDIVRPLKYFSQNGIEIYVPDGVKLHKYFSFPSGHSSTSFAVFTLIALILLPGKYRWIALLIALMVAFSRVYLGQHFIPDITAGSFIGVFSATFIFWLFTEKNNKFSNKNHWLNHCCPIKKITAQK